MTKSFLLAGNVKKKEEKEKYSEGNTQEMFMIKYNYFSFSLLYFYLKNRMRKKHSFNNSNLSLQSLTEPLFFQQSKRLSPFIAMGTCVISDVVAKLSLLVFELAFNASWHNKINWQALKRKRKISILA